jgi:hypothetical protein
MQQQCKLGSVPGFRYIHLNPLRAGMVASLDELENVGGADATSFPATPLTKSNCPKNEISANLTMFTYLFTLWL